MAGELIFPTLVDDIRQLILSGRSQVVTAINVALLRPDRFEMRQIVAPGHWAEDLCALV